MKPKFTLNPADVSDGFSGTNYSSGRGGRMTKTSRASGLTDARVELRHEPTGISVSGEIPLGHYSRQEMIKRRKTLEGQLWIELEKKVIAFLRLPGC